MNFMGDTVATWVRGVHPQWTEGAPFWAWEASARMGVGWWWWWGDLNAPDQGFAGLPGPELLSLQRGAGE